jgi:hypothetical protein
MTTTFRYELAGLQRVQDYQIDRLVAELTEMKEKLSNQQDVVRKIDAQIAEHEDQLTRLIREQPLFWIEARELTASYVVQLRSERIGQFKELERLTVATTKLMAEIVEARKARTLLDKHRSRRLDMHMRNEERHNGQLVDELALRQRIL